MCNISCVKKKLCTYKLSILYVNCQYFDDALFDTSSVHLDVDKDADDASENVYSSVELDGFSVAVSAILSDSDNAMDGDDEALSDSLDDAMDGDVPETNINDSRNVFDSDVYVEHDNEQ